MHDEWDDLLRSKMDGHPVEPSPGVWKKIDTRLSGGKKGFPYFWVVSMAAAILFLMIFFREKPAQEIETQPGISLKQTDTVQPDLQAEETHESAVALQQESPATQAVRHQENSPPRQKQIQPAPMPLVQVKKESPAVEENIQRNISPQPEQVANVPEMPKPSVREQPKEEEIKVVWQDPQPAPVQPEVPVVSKGNSLFANMLDVAGALFKMDTQWQEKREPEKKTVLVSADLGFLSIKKTTVYKQQ